MHDAKKQKINLESKKINFKIMLYRYFEQISNFQLII